MHTQKHTTYSISIHFVSGSTATSNYRLQHSHPALLVREAGGHEVEGLAWPAGSVGMRLQLQHIWDVCEHTQKDRQVGYLCSFISQFSRTVDISFILDILKLCFV